MISSLLLRSARVGLRPQNLHRIRGVKLNGRLSNVRYLATPTEAPEPFKKPTQGADVSKQENTAKQPPQISHDTSRMLQETSWHYMGSTEERLQARIVPASEINMSLDANFPYYIDPTVKQELLYASLVHLRSPSMALDFQDKLSY
eukprot:Colp12_sorted_trinity150504_noHs@9249